MTATTTAYSQAHTVLHATQYGLDLLVKLSNGQSYLTPMVTTPEVSPGDRVRIHWDEDQNVSGLSRVAHS